MAFPIRVVIAFATVTFVGTVAQGQTTWFVDDANCPGPGTGSQPDPFCTIQAGMDAATNGDTVIVADGIYTGPDNKNLDFDGKAITLRSANGAGSCIIDCEGDGRGFEFQSGETPDTVLDGFTITGGYVYVGAGILCHDFSSPTIKNCVIRNNSATLPAGGPRGGGLYLANCSPALINCTITQNTSGYGGGIYLHSANPRITNCTISGNSCNYGRGGGIYAYYASNPTMTNSIMWNNFANFGAEIFLYGSSSDGYPTLTVSYSDIERGQAGAWLATGNEELIWGEGNIDADPVFAFADDHHLMPGSPCIDAGTNNPPGGLPQTDRDGNPRPLDGNGDGIQLPDMGAHEYNAQEPCIALSRYTAEFFAGIGGANPDQQVLSIRNCGGGTLSWQSVAGCGWLQPVPSTGTSTGEIDEVTLQVDIVGVEHGKHICPLMMFDEEAVTSPRSMQATLSLSSTLHVPGKYETIQAAIDSALPSDDIVLVADGTYTGPGNKNLDFGGKVITVRSENGPESCIIDCEGDGRGFVFNSGEVPEAVVWGFTITNGLANSGGGIWFSRSSSPTISNCRIAGNTAVSIGGGIYCRYPSSPTFLDSTITGNSAFFGGGNYVESSPVFTNCSITGNTSNSGGGIYCAASSSPTLVNSILWNNTATNGPEIALKRHTEHGICPSVTVTYCNVEGGYGAVYLDGCQVNWREGNIDADPLFEDADGLDGVSGTEDDNLRLLPGSPSIDAGDNTAVPTDVITDLDGNRRFVDVPATADTGNGTPPIVDMGAYEFQDCEEGVVDPNADYDSDGVLNCNDLCRGVDDAVFAPECDGAIPTTSQWGLVVMALLLLTGHKLKFGGRRPQRD